MGTINKIRIIINADDFGYSSDVNQAVIRAYREGVLTSASLMVAGEAAEEAVKLAHENPGLAVGLHLVVVDGKAACLSKEIRGIVDSEGNFNRSPVHAGIRYFLKRSLHKALLREIEEQFKRFAQTGLKLSHVDGHCNMHLHPTVFRIATQLASRHGAHGIRIPHDNLLASLRFDPHHPIIKFIWTWMFKILELRSRKILRRSTLKALPCVVGLLQSGAMKEDYVISIVNKLKTAAAELYFHPSLTTSIPLGPNPDDFATLLSPALADAISDKNAVLSTYSDF